MSNGSSSSCLKCVEWKGKATKLEETVAFVEAKTRDCVRAYKTVLKEKNIILQNFEASKELFAKRVEEEEKRLATLEDSLNELSSICGKYEAENVKKQTLIDKLNQRCDELTQQLAAYESNIDGQSLNCDNIEQSSLNDQDKPVPKYNKWTQTIILDSEEEKDELKKELNTQDQETQTTCQEFVNLKHKKTECAIVLPTHREIEVEKSTTNVDSRRGSHGSRGSGSETVFTDTEFNLNETESRPFESVRPSSNSANSVTNQEIPSNSVSLFYVNELARKEIELVETRLTARENECALRELRWKYNVDTFKLQSKVTRLEQQLQQLQNDDTTKPNLTYIRNVLVRFLKTKDKKQKSCMMNALLTALGVDQKEIKT